jgi:hypothetical protein
LALGEERQVGQAKVMNVNEALASFAGGRAQAKS